MRSRTTATHRKGRSGPRRNCANSLQWWNVTCGRRQARLQVALLAAALEALFKLSHERSLVLSRLSLRFWARVTTLGGRCALGNRVAARSQHRPQGRGSHDGKSGDTNQNHLASRTDNEHSEARDDAKDTQHQTAAR